MSGSDSARKQRVLFIYGTRPELIKLAPLILAAKLDSRFEALICSTGQHREMLKPLEEFFGINPDEDLALMKPGQRLVELVGRALGGLDACVKRLRPDAIVVQGDTTTGFAAGLYGFYEKIAVDHVEAGLRSGDLQSPYPEEFNRRALTLAARMHFVPTETARENLLREGIKPDAIVLTGNTGIDALLAVKARLDEDPSLRSERANRFRFLVPHKKLVLVTLHRRENIGDPMRQVARALLRLSREPNVQILISAHLNPAVRSILSEVFGDRAVWSNAAPVGQPLILSEPFDYISFVYLMERAHLILTDSGGIQEEAPALGKALLVARATTERTEAVNAGNARLLPLDEASVFSEAHRLLTDSQLHAAMAQVRFPFGDGRASGRILDAMAMNPLPLIASAE